MSPDELEKTYRHFTKNVKKWLPDGLIKVNLELLCELELLNKKNFDHEEPDEVTHYFSVEEIHDKIILHNDKFVIWIVPAVIENISMTHTYISQMHNQAPKLELVYENRGIYNSPKFILQILEHFLIETLDTDALLASMKKGEN